MQVHIEASPDLAAEFKARFDVELDLRARQYYNATQMILTVAGRTLAAGRPLTGETLRDTLFAIRKFPGLIPLVFETNTATVPLDIELIKDGQGITIKQKQSG